jgi:hypothetical protein
MKEIGLHMKNKEILYQDSFNQISGDLSDIIKKLVNIKKKFTKLGYTDIKINYILKDPPFNSVVSITGVKNNLSKLHKILSKF